MSLAILLTSIQTFCFTNSVPILALTLAASESLASVPTIKSNSICQLVLNIVIFMTKNKKA